MASYVDFDFYKKISGAEAIPEAEFLRLSWGACRRLDRMTTGIDGVRKLKAAFPVDEEDAEAVKRCACAFVDAAYRVEQAGKENALASGFVESENGVHGKVISSISAGNESISFSASSESSESAFSKAAASKEEEAALYNDIVREYLSGIADANGVNLLYMGRYPFRCSYV